MTYNLEWREYDKCLALVFDRAGKFTYFLNLVAVLKLEKLRENVIDGASASCSLKKWRLLNILRAKSRTIYYKVCNLTHFSKSILLCCTYLRFCILCVNYHAITISKTGYKGVHTYCLKVVSLFYWCLIISQVLIDNFEEYAPIVHTPTIIIVCQNSSSIFRSPWGVYLSLEDQVIWCPFSTIC
jgi:hypothetical protein